MSRLKLIPEFDIPIPFAFDDDHVGTVQLVLDQSDLIPGGSKDKELHIQSSEGDYIIGFRITGANLSRIGQQHVFYRGTDGAINHIFYDQPTNQLYRDQWTVITNAPPAAGDPATLTSANPNQQHVFYRGTDGAINHIFYDQPTNQLYHDQWTAITNAPPAAGDPATLTSADPNQQHVFYRGTDGEIEHIFWDGPTNQLYHDAWTLRTGTDLAAGDPATMVTDW